MSEEKITRSEHLEWCKQRALEYVDIGDMAQAWSSMASDLGKHSETANHGAIELGSIMLIGGQLSSPDEMRKFINGFH